MASYAQDAPPNCARMLNALPQDMAEQLAGVLQDDMQLTEPVKAVQDCLKRIRRYDCKRQIETLTLELADSSIEPHQREKLMQQIQNLTRQLRG